jgi:hypothetical protein
MVVDGGSVGGGCSLADLITRRLLPGQVEGNGELPSTAGAEQPASGHHGTCVLATRRVKLVPMLRGGVGCKRVGGRLHIDY